jgi:hypothetical protein
MRGKKKSANGASNPTERKLMVSKCCMYIASFEGCYDHARKYDFPYPLLLLSSEEGVHLSSEMDAESGVLWRRFLLAYHPRIFYPI